MSRFPAKNVNLTDCRAGPVLVSNIVNSVMPTCSSVRVVPQLLLPPETTTSLALNLEAALPSYRPSLTAALTCPVNSYLSVLGSRTVAFSTGQSTLIFASVIVLLNDYLVAAGKSPLGFLSSFLYSSAGPAALNEVASGAPGNPGYNTNGFPTKAG
ncbi:hypothetical protein M0805_000107 [Coniferiporia weirii]|nr:hypothetical protein M0805_000107 [Coniferiporia weirii]